MGAMATHITTLTIVYSTIFSGADQRTHQTSASLAFVREIHRWPMHSLYKWPVKRKMFPFDDVIMNYEEIDKKKGVSIFRRHVKRDMTLNSILLQYIPMIFSWCNPKKNSFVCIQLQLMFVSQKA